VRSRCLSWAGRGLAGRDRGASTFGLRPFRRLRALQGYDLQDEAPEDSLTFAIPRGPLEGVDPRVGGYPFGASTVRTSVAVRWTGGCAV
jgi:hypothetical protein